MTLKERGNKRVSKNSKVVKIVKCKNCKIEYDFKSIEEDIYKVGNKCFYLCKCENQIKIK